MEFGYWRRRHRGKSRLFISSSARRTDWLSDFLPPAVPFFHRAIYRGSDADSGLSRVIRTRNLCRKSRVAPVRRGADRSHHEYKFSLINRRRHQVAVERPTSRGRGKGREAIRGRGRAMTATTIVITKTASSSSSRRRRGYRMIHGGLPWHTCEKASLGALKPRPLPWWFKRIRSKREMRWEASIIMRPLTSHSRSRGERDSWHEEAGTRDGAEYRN